MTPRNDFPRLRRRPPRDGTGEVYYGRKLQEALQRPEDATFTAWGAMVWAGVVFAAVVVAVWIAW